MSGQKNFSWWNCGITKAGSSPSLPIPGCLETMDKERLTQSQKPKHTTQEIMEIRLSLLSLVAFTLASTAAQAGMIISEQFSGSHSSDLVGKPTPGGNNWTGASGEIPKLEEPAAGDTETTAAPRFSVKKDGSAGGIAFTAYHKFTLKPGQVYTLEAELSPVNKMDNQWFVVGFCVTARDGNAAPQLDGGTTYGQTVLSGSGYRYGWTGPDVKDMCELMGPGLHLGPVKVVLDTSNSKDYTIELFDGEGESIHGPKSIGAPAITQVFIGNSGANGSFKSLTLSDNAPETAAKTDPKPETEQKPEE